jgi:hypothetical protein
MPIVPTAARPLIKLLFAVWPSTRFYWRLVELTNAWSRRHHLTPLPTVKP